MDNKKEIETIKAMREIAYFTFLDALKGLKDATRLIDERVQKDGPKANCSVDSDLLTWSQAVWKASNRLYNIDQVMSVLLGKDLAKSANDEEVSDIR